MKTTNFALILALCATLANAQWQRTNGPYRVNITSLAANGSNIFAGTDGGGVFLSTNFGSSWTAVNNGLTISSIYSLAVSGSNIFAGTDGKGVFVRPLAK